MASDIEEFIEIPLTNKFDQKELIDLLALGVFIVEGYTTKQINNNEKTTKY